MSDFVMPSLGADMEAGTVLEWYVKPGDTVKRGDIIALVDTSKARDRGRDLPGRDDRRAAGPGGRTSSRRHGAGDASPGRRRGAGTGTGWTDRSTDAGTASSTDRGHRATHAAAGTRPSRGGAGRHEPPAARVPPGPACRGWARGKSISRRSPEAGRTAQSPRRTSSVPAQGPSHRHRWNGRRRPRPHASQATVRPPCARRSARDGAQQPRDPALLPAADDRHGPRLDWFATRTATAR